MKYMTAAQAVQLINSGDSLYIQGSTSIPEVLSQALADRGNELRDVTVYAAFAVGRCEAPYCRPEYKEAFNVKSLFVANNIRRWLADGYGTTIPAFLGEIPALFRDGTLPLDAVFLNVSPPNSSMSMFAIVSPSERSDHSISTVLSGFVALGHWRRLRICLTSAREKRLVAEVSGTRQRPFALSGR